MASQKNQPGKDHPFYALPLGGVPIQIGVQVNPVTVGNDAHGWATFEALNEVSHLKLTYYTVGEVLMDPTGTDTSVPVPASASKVTFHVTCKSNGSGYGTVTIVGTRNGLYGYATLQVKP